MTEQEAEQLFNVAYKAAYDRARARRDNSSNALPDLALPAVYPHQSARDCLRQLGEYARARILDLDKQWERQTAAQDEYTATSRRIDGIAARYYNTPRGDRPRIVNEIVQALAI
jgi:hypothetical protein